MLSWSVLSGLRACGSVSYTLKISSDGMMMMMIMNTIDTSYNITGLTSGTDYTVSIELSNRAGSGDTYTETIWNAPNSKC